MSDYPCAVCPAVFSAGRGRGAHESQAHPGQLDDIWHERRLARRRARRAATRMDRPRVPRKRSPLADRFWSKVDRDGPVPAHVPGIGPCWTWTGSASPEGYGHVLGEDQRMRGAHRASWEMAYGPIPDGQLVCHRCDNPPCVNPAHLFLGDQADNMRDMHAKGRAREARQ